MEYAKTSYFATYDYIGVVSIQAEKTLKVICMKNAEVFQKRMR